MCGSIVFLVFLSSCCPVDCSVPPRLESVASNSLSPHQLLQRQHRHATNTSDSSTTRALTVPHSLHRCTVPAASNARWPRAYSSPACLCSSLCFSLLLPLACVSVPRVAAVPGHAAAGGSAMRGAGRTRLLPDPRTATQREREAGTTGGNQTDGKRAKDTSQRTRENGEDSGLTGRCVVISLCDFVADQESVSLHVQAASPRSVPIVAHSHFGTLRSLSVNAATAPVAAGASEESTY